MSFSSESFQVGLICLFFLTSSLVKSDFNIPYQFLHPFLRYHLFVYFISLVSFIPVSDMYHIIYFTLAADCYFIKFCMCNWWADITFYFYRYPIFRYIVPRHLTFEFENYESVLKLTDLSIEILYLELFFILFIILQIFIRKYRFYRKNKT